MSFSQHGSPARAILYDLLANLGIALAKSAEDIHSLNSFTCTGGHKDQFKIENRPFMLY